MFEIDKISSLFYSISTWLVFGFLVLPLLVIILTSFSQSTSLIFPPKVYSLEWYYAISDNQTWIEAFRNSIIIGIGTAAFSSVVGIAAAFGLHGNNSWWARLMVVIVLVPFLVPPVVFGISLLSFYDFANFRRPYLQIIMAHSLWAIPLVFFITRSVLTRFDWNLRDAGMDLGATPIRNFLYIIAPEMKEGIAVAVLIAFVSSLQEFIMALFLSTASTRTIPVVAWHTLTVSLSPIISVASTFLVAISLFILLAAILLTNLEWVARQLG